MSGRWQHRLIEVKVRLLGGKTSEHVQAELDRMGTQGWQLVSVVQTSTLDPVRLYFKQEA